MEGGTIVLLKFVSRSGALIGAALLIAIMPAKAALITFSDRSAFEAAVTGLTTITFEGLVAAHSAVNFENPAGLTESGVNFRTSGTGPLGSGFVTIYGAAVAAQSEMLNTGTGAILGWAPPNQPGTAFLDVRLPHGVTAFATDLWAQQPFATTIDVTINSGEATEIFRIPTQNHPTASFFGVISDSNVILLARFGIPAGQVGLVLDDVGFGTANGGPTSNPVPEPKATVLVCAGLLGLTIVEQRRRL
jgi:hypothetical protein